MMSGGRETAVVRRRGILPSTSPRPGRVPDVRPSFPTLIYSSLRGWWVNGSTPAVLTLSTSCDGMWNTETSTTVEVQKCTVTQEEQVWDHGRHSRRMSYGPHRCRNVLRSRTRPRTSTDETTSSVPWIDTFHRPGT